MCFFNVDTLDFLTLLITTFVGWHVGDVKNEKSELKSLKKHNLFFAGDRRDSSVILNRRKTEKDGFGQIIWNSVSHGSG